MELAPQGSARLREHSGARAGTLRGPEIPWRKRKECLLQRRQGVAKKGHPGLERVVLSSVDARRLFFTAKLDEGAASTKRTEWLVLLFNEDVHLGSGAQNDGAKEAPRRRFPRG